MLRAASDARNERDGAIYDKSLEKSAVRKDIAETAKKLEEEDKLLAYEKHVVKSSESTDALELTKNLEIVTRTAEAAEAHEKSATKEALLKTAKELKAKELEADYAAATEKAEAKADLLRASADAREELAEASYDKSLEKSALRKDILETAKTLQTEKDIESYEKHVLKSSEGTEALELTKNLEIVTRTAEAAEAHEKSATKEALLKTAKELKAKELEADYAAATEKAEAKADLLRASADAREELAEASYDKSLEKSALRKDILETAKTLQTEKDIESYEKHVLKSSEGTEALELTKNLGIVTSTAEVTKAHEKAAEKKALLESAKELKAKAEEEAYASATEKKRDTSELIKEAKYIAAVEGYTEYNKKKEKADNTDKLLRIAKELQAKQNASSYDEAQAKAEKRADIAQVSKTIASAELLEDYDSGAEKLEEKEAIKSALRVIAADDVTEAYAAHAEKVAERRELAEMAKETKATDTINAYAEAAEKSEALRSIKATSAVEVKSEAERKAMSAYEIAVAKKKYEEALKLEAAAYRYSTGKMAEINRKLEDSEKAADMKATVKASKDAEAMKAYTLAEEKKKENHTDAESKNAIIKEYEDNKLLEKYNKHITKDLISTPKDERELTEMQEEMRTLARQEMEREQFANMSRHDFKRYIRSERKDEKGIINELRRTRHKYKTSTKAVGLPYLRESINYSGEILERYLETYKAALSIRHKKYMKEYERKATYALNEYIADLNLWSEVTKEAVPYVPKTLVKDIKEGKDVKPVPYIDKEFKLSEKQQKKLLKKDLTRFLKEEEKYRRRAREMEEVAREEHLADGDETVITRYHMKTDIDTVKSKIEYRKQRYIQEFKRFRYTFGEETLQSERKHIAQAKKLKKMKKHTKRFIRFAKKNDDRYYKLANMSMNDIHVNSAVKRDRVDILLRRIRNLLMERDEVNMRLLTLYADENANPEKKRNTQRKRIDKIKLRASKRSFRKQRFLYREARSFRVPQAHKDRIYEVMNRKTELRAYLAECKYRKRHEKSGTMKSRRVIRQEIRDTKRKLRYCERDLDIFMTKASKRSKRTPKKIAQFFWTLALIALTVGVVYGYIYLMSNKDAVGQWITDTIAKLGGFITPKN